MLRSRLIQCGILPLMYTYEIVDILFFIKPIKHPSDKFDILNYINITTGTNMLAPSSAPRQPTPTLL